MSAKKKLELKPKKTPQELLTGYTGDERILGKTEHDLSMRQPKTYKHT